MVQKCKFGGFGKMRILQLIFGKTVIFGKTS